MMHYKTRISSQGSAVARHFHADARRTAKEVAQRYWRSLHVRYVDINTQSTSLSVSPTNSSLTSLLTTTLQGFILASLIQKSEAQGFENPEKGGIAVGVGVGACIVFCAIGCIVKCITDKINTCRERERRGRTYQIPHHSISLPTQRLNLQPTYLSERRHSLPNYQESEVLEQALGHPPRYPQTPPPQYQSLATVHFPELDLVNGQVVVTDISDTASDTLSGNEADVSDTDA